MFGSISLQVNENGGMFCSTGNQSRHKHETEGILCELSHIVWWCSSGIFLQTIIYLFLSSVLLSNKDKCKAAKNVKIKKKSCWMDVDWIHLHLSPIPHCVFQNGANAF